MRDEIIYPMRINKYLAAKSICSRREADKLIEAGLVLINGNRANLGDKVELKDIVEVASEASKDKMYFAYHKPRGVVTHSPQEGESDVQEMLRRDDVYPIGRLDKDSEGLLILTNDGRLTQKLLHPDNKHEKEYVVAVDKDIKSNDLKKLEHGVNIEGYVTKKCRAKKLGKQKLSLIITEGKKHQIRRMLAALGYQVKSLKRLRVANITLGKLKKNATRPIENTELEQLLKLLDL